MPGRSARAALPIVIVGGAVVAAAGVVALVERVADRRRDHRPAPDGTPRIEGRLPVSLWPSSGSEPVVPRTLGGWREMLVALYHRDTVVDDAARARAVVIAQYPRREQDARRQAALEAHVLLGAYEPALIAAAWLHPLKGIRIDDLASLGMSPATLATVRAVQQLDADPELIGTWRRELGIDVVRPEITARIVADTEPERLGMLWAVLLDLAESRIAAR
jgi:hypothetical protein